MAGTGVPLAPAEAEGHGSRIEGQPAHTREARLGCLFTQTTANKQDRGVREEKSSAYVGLIETAAEFGLRLYTEAWLRGWSRAGDMVALGDGVVWLWDFADPYFPGTIRIVDQYQARQHLCELAAKLFPGDQEQRQRWLAQCLDRLDRGQIRALTELPRELHPTDPELARLFANAADYFKRNAARKRYPQFRTQGLFVGSGVIEAGCKTVIGGRLKGSGMIWTLCGANAIIDLRCCRLLLCASRMQQWYRRRVPVPRPKGSADLLSD